MTIEQIEKLIGERSYDIIKAHGGEIKLESKEGESLSGEQTETEFIIQLPFV